MSMAKMNDEVKENRPSNSAPSLALRPVLPEDEQFLYEVYKSTRSEEMALWGWDSAQQDAFLKMQFKAQQLAYGMEDGQTETTVILLEGRPVGRLVLTRTGNTIQLSDIALLTEYRNNGIGTALIKDLFDEATRAGKSVLLHVLKTNHRAMRLYERLGFKTTNESGMHFQMEWIPGV
jgi:ribosomal protein S18 acetylase RimI-like enzyme